MTIKEYDRTSKKKKKTSKVLKLLKWILLVSLPIGLICGGILIYKLQTHQSQRQKLARLQARLQELEAQQEKIQKQYQQQELNLISANSLAEKPTIRAFFSDLLTIYAEKFAQNKKIDISQLPLKFKGFYWDKKTGKGFGEMGYCSLKGKIYPAQKKAKIALNRLYLLNKLGYNEYFTSNPQYGNYTYIDISFTKMINTCCHELAHYFQLVKWGRSSCKSDLILGNGEYSEELAKEHKEWTGEIYQLIKIKLPELEKRWREI